VGSSAKPTTHIGDSTMMVKVQSRTNKSVIDVAQEHWVHVLQPQGQYFLVKEDVIPSKDSTDPIEVVPEIKRSPGRPKKVNLSKDSES
jgi:hypothetical protein